MLIKKKNWNDCIIFCYKKNLEISFQNGPEDETTSLIKIGISM